MEDVLNVADLAILFQRRYSFIKDVKDITDKLSEAISGNDGYTAEVILEERGDAIRKVEHATEQIRLLGEAGPKAAFTAHRLIYTEPDDIAPETDDEKLVREIRLKTKALVEVLQKQDKMLNKRLTRDQSFYKD
ncbi:hypothetical protein [Oribacterium sp. P6A1]|uniref:hypothetical protein n=1 Tax=Oribacterium sp. P6A1 TaxID=1410612 RepID=UPI000568C094|nr:hypothetical protein [Oribacterium sp. P6A1]